MATIVDTFRPFLQALWGAMRAVDANAGDGRVPKVCIWQSRIAHALLWIAVFLSSLRGRLQRTFSLWDRIGMGTKIVMYTSFSPWGIGGILVVNGEIAAWIAGGLDAADEDMLDIRIGDPAGQQAGELLAVLVALRAWRQFCRSAISRRHP